jgi:hypothetical protein
MISLKLKPAAALIWIGFVLPVLADTSFSIRRMARDDVPFGQGQCDIRLQVDNEAEVRVRGMQVDIRTFAGRGARDDGSECNEPLPNRAPERFNYEVRDSRGDVALLSPPSRANGYSAIFRIRDSKSGEGRYHIRLTWALTGAGDFRGDGGRRPFDDRRSRDFDDRGGGLRIISARYGDDRRSRDVTPLVRDMVRGGRLSVRATNQDMRGDPAVGSDKYLTVVYEYRGRREERRVREGASLELP